MKCVKNKKQKQNIVLTFVVPRPECQNLGSSVSCVGRTVLTVMHRGSDWSTSPSCNAQTYGLGLAGAGILLPGLSGVEVAVRKTNVPREERARSITQNIYIFKYIYLKDLVLKYFYHVCMYM